MKARNMYLKSDLKNALSSHVLCVQTCKISIELILTDEERETVKKSWTLYIKV